MRCVLLLALTACWTSGPAPKPEPYVIPPRVEPPPEPPVACAVFAEADPTCATACARDAPDDWRGCETLAAELQREGYVCSNLHPRTRLSPLQLPVTCPPGGCVPVKARVIGMTVDGSSVTITLGAGSTQGVTASWRARVIDLDASGNVSFVPGGDVTTLRVDRSKTLGTTRLTLAELRSRYVLLEP